MNMHWKWQISLILIGGLLSAYFIFRPSYQLRYYKLGFYPYTYLTQLIYSAVGDRQLIYIYGKYDQDSYPEKDFVVQPDFAGFDSYSVVNAVCDSNHNVILFFDDGLFVTPVPSKKIETRQAFSGDLSKQPGMTIKAH